jgi:hypothetical protein
MTSGSGGAYPADSFQGLLDAHVTVKYLTRLQSPNDKVRLGSRSRLGRDRWTGWVLPVHKPPGRRRRRFLLLFIRIQSSSDTKEGPRATAVKPGRVTQFLLEFCTVEAVLGKYTSAIKVKDGNTVGVVSGICI